MLFLATNHFDATITYNPKVVHIKLSLGETNRLVLLQNVLVALFTYQRELFS